MKKIAYIFLILLSTVGFLQSCEDTYLPPPLEYVTFGDAVYSTGVDIGGSTTLEIPVYTGNITSADRSFNVIVDDSNAAPGSFSVPSSVTVPGGTNEGTLAVNLSDVDLGIGVNRLNITFENGAEFSNGPAATVEYIQNCNEIIATLDFAFDYYSSETGWYITDALDGVVASKSGYADGQGSASESITLCAGRDYTLYVTDVYGDGMNDGTNLGSYTLTIDGTVKATGGGNFGASEASAFDTN
ncbi:hypothetical protein [Flaviramulus basaltis]|nr:hypothetical protein [Flaviramulus basaltis]